MRRNLLIAFILFLAPQAYSAANGVAASANDIRPLLIGAKVPDPALRRIDGSPVGLSELLDNQPAILIFYRGGWCPYCNTHLMELRDAQPEILKLGYRIFAISPDKPEELQRTSKRHGLPYALLSDSKMGAARAFGVAFQLDDETLKKYKEKMIDLDQFTGEKHHWLPVPSVFIVGKDGLIKFEYVNPDFKTRISAELLLAAAKAARN